MGKLLEIFKAGKHTAMGGQRLAFSAADLRDTVAAYDPAKHEAPLVVGHPGIDAPAYGWVKGLNFAGGVLFADADQVDPAFAGMVNDGRFKKVSASFYRPDAPNNPAPGVYYLRHVGFLGAQPPAVRGLKSASFAAAEEGVVEFGDWTDRVEAGLWRKMREWIIGKFGQEEADKALPGWDVDAVQNDAAQEDREPVTAPAFGEKRQKEEEGMTQVELAARAAALREQEAAFAEREGKLKQQEQAARHREHLAFAEGLAAAGKLLPAQKAQAVAMLDYAAGLEGGVVEFGEGEAKQSLAMADALKTFLGAQPKIVQFGEIAKPEGAASHADFAAPPGSEVNPETLALHAKAIAYQHKNPGTDYMAAVKAVQ